MKALRFIKGIVSILLVISMVPPLSSCNTVLVPEAVRTPKPDLMKDRYELEEAELVNLGVSTELDDYSGSGCIKLLKANGTVTFTVEADENAVYGVYLRYANGTGAEKSIIASVNGTAEAVALPVTPNATTWLQRLIPVSLNKGANTISFSCDNENEGVSLDRIDIARLYQSEEASLKGSIGARRTYDGYTGNGYTTFSATGDEVTFTVNAPTDGSYELTLRYSADQTDSAGRSCTLKLNGDEGEKLLVNPTRSHEIWGVYRHTVSLKQGENILSFRQSDSDNGSFNLDCITLKPVNWEYAGKIEELTGSGTDQLTLKLDNCVIRIDSVARNSLKIWADKDGLFSRKYESAAVVNEKVNPQKLKVREKKDYYSFDTGDLTVRLYKDPFRIVYLDGEEIVAMNDAYSLGFSSSDELICRHVMQEDEHFAGLGETPLSFDRRNTKSAFWGNDIVASRGDSAVPAETKDGRWYMNNPVFTSSKGYTILFDNPSRTVFDFGVDDPNCYYFASLNPYPAGELIYYFIYGPTVKEEMKGLNEIIGDSFFAPLYGYGNMQSHWGYTQADIERVAQEYRDKNIPLDIIISDIEWYQNFCTPTQWNSSNYPNPEKMKELLEELNVRYGVIDDPNITASCQDYKIGDKYGYFVKDSEGNTLNVHWPWGNQSGLVDFFNPEAQEWWRSLHSMIEAFGVDFYWMDMNEPASYNANWYFYNKENKAMGTVADCKNIFAQMQQRTMFELTTEDNSRSLMLTRSGYTGTHRYAAPWTGDIYSDWEAMQQQLSLCLGLSMSGYMYFTFDIGGSSGGHDDNMWKRWIQLATFMPLTRYHSTASDVPRESYTHNSEEVARDYISLRYRLMPYFYSLSADSIIGIGIENESGGSGLPLVRPMLMEYENDLETWGIDNQFMCGESFLVAPVMTMLLRRNIYLPKGDAWYDYNNKSVTYEGGQTIKYDAPIDTLPVLVKAGSIVPMSDVVQYVGEKELDTLYLDIYPTLKDGEYSFVYYEDDGESLDYQNGEYATTRYEGKTNYKALSNKVEHTLKICKRRGSYTDIADRDYILQFNVLDHDFVKAEINGNKLTEVSSYEELKNAEQACFVKDGVVYVKTRDTAEEITVKVTVTE